MRSESRGKRSRRILFWLAGVWWLAYNFLASYYFPSSQPVLAAGPYNPSSESILTGTGISGSTSNLSSDDSSYRTIRGAASVYNADYRVTVSEAQSQTTVTSWTTKVTDTWTVPTTDNYLILATAEIQRSSTTAARTTGVTIGVDGTPATSAGIYQSYSRNTATYFSVGIVRVASLSAGSHTITILYRTTHSSNTASIQNARLTVLRIGGDYQAAEPPDGTTTSSSYTDIATVSFTPELTQDWVAFAYAEIGNFSATTNTNYVNLDVGGVQQSESAPRNLTTNTTAGFVGVLLIDQFSLAGGASRTVKIQMRTTGGTLTYRNVRLYLLPASLFNEVQYNESDSEATTTSSSRSDKASFTFTPASTADYLVIGMMAVHSHGTAANNNGWLVVDGSDYGANVFRPTATTTSSPYVPYPVFTSSKVLSLNNTSHTVKLQYASANNSTIIRVQYSKVIAIRLPPASEYQVVVEYTGNSDGDNWTSLVWKVDSSWSLASVSVVLQLYDFNAPGYPSSGDGYISYTSSSTPNTDELQSQTISTNPTYFRGNGPLYQWRVKVTGTISSTSWVNWNGDWISFEPQTQSLSISSPASVTLNPGNPGTTTSPYTFTTGEYVTVSSNGYTAWTLSAQITLPPVEIPAANWELGTDGNMSNIPTLVDSPPAGVSEPNNGYLGLDSSRTVVSYSGGSGSVTADTRPTLRVVIPPSTPPNDYNANLRFTVV